MENDSLFSDVENYLRKERSKLAYKKFFLTRVLTSVWNKLNEEADLKFRRRAAYTVATVGMVMMGCATYDALRPRTLEQRIERPDLSNEGKIGILESFLKKDCVGTRVDISDCVRRKVWASGQIDIIRSQQPKSSR